MSKVKNSDYICLSAMLRAKEARMLTKDKLNDLVSEPTFDDIAKVLTEYGYPDMSGMTNQEINRTLEEHFDALVEEVSEMIPDKDVLNILRLKYEYHNIKCVIKGGGLNEESEKLLSHAGRADLETLREVYETGSSGTLPMAVVEHINSAKTTLARTGNPQLADFILDKAYFTGLLETAEKTGSEFVKRYVQVLIDSANIRCTVRAMLVGRRADLLTQALIPGGTLDVQDIIGSMDTKDNLARLYQNSRFAKAAEASNITSFELEADNAVNDFLAESEYVSYGPESVLAYLVAAENEVMALRIILTGRRMGIAPDLLRERLRDSYV